MLTSVAHLTAHHVRQASSRGRDSYENHHPSDVDRAKTEEHRAGDAEGHGDQEGREEEERQEGDEQRGDRLGDDFSDDDEGPPDTTGALLFLLRFII